MLSYSSGSTGSVASLEHSHAHCLHVVYGCFPTTTADWNSFNRDLLACKASNINRWPLQEKFAGSRSGAKQARPGKGFVSHVE